MLCENYFWKIFALSNEKIQWTFHQILDFLKWSFKTGIIKTGHSVGCERVPSLILQSCNYVDVFMFYILSTIIYLLSNGLNLSFLTFSLIIICPLHIAWPFWARTAERNGWFSIVNPICESSKTLANTKNKKYIL